MQPSRSVQKNSCPKTFCTVQSSVCNFTKEMESATYKFCNSAMVEYYGIHSVLNSPWQSTNVEVFAEAIEFLWILKIYIFLFKKETFCFIKKLLLFFTRFSNLFLWRRSFTVLFTNFLFILLLFSYISF